jgi:hypothetical protein
MVTDTNPKFLAFIRNHPMVTDPTYKPKGNIFKFHLAKAQRYKGLEVICKLNALFLFIFIMKIRKRIIRNAQHTH